MLLSIDTSSSHCLVTLGNASEKFFSRVCESERSHSKVLLPLIQEVLVEANMALADLSGLSVAIGPGSFVGVRLGVSVIQGLALGANLKVWPISSLQILAQSYLLQQQAENLALNSLNQIRVLRDAHMGDIYVGEYGSDKLNPKIMRSMRSVTPMDLINLDLIDQEESSDFIEKAEYGLDKKLINPGILAISLMPKALHQIAWDCFSREAGRQPEDISPVYLRGASLWKKSI